MLSLFRRGRQAEAPADIRRFVAVGYPKVGNTWLRVMLGRYLQKAYGLAEMPLLDAGDLLNLKSAGVAALGDFTHTPLTWETQTAADLTVESVIRPFRNLKVMLLIRHPLDVLVSHYMHMRYQNRDKPYQGDLLAMIDDPVLGIQKFFQFYNIWVEHRDEIGDFMLWRYEDARAAPAKTLREVLVFLGEQVDDALVDDAARYSSFDNMKSWEKAGNQPTYKSSGFQIFATGDLSNPNAFHVRKGEVGGWRDEISPETAKRLEERIRAELPSFCGYN